MTDARSLIDKLGRRAIADALSVDPSTVSHAYRSNRLPGWWYGTLCEMVGDDNLPHEWFAMQRRGRKADRAA